MRFVIDMIIPIWYNKSINIKEEHIMEERFVLAGNLIIDTLTGITELLSDLAPDTSPKVTPEVEIPF